MKKRFLIAAALILTLISGIAIGANAGGYVDITASLAYPISIKYNGEVQVMKDANGNQVYPITYQGTTYVPIRAVSNMLGIAVDWDQETQSVLLGETPKTEPKIVFYEDFPEVPDFGAFAGISTAFEPFGNATKGMLYDYSILDLIEPMQERPDLLVDYGDLLFAQGFLYDEALSYENFTIMYKGNLNVGILLLGGKTLTISVSPR